MLLFPSRVDILTNKNSVTHTSTRKMNFQKTTAIITGGTGALGSVVASCFFQAGANIAIPRRKQSSMALLPEEMLVSTGRVMLAEADISVEQQVEEFVAEVMGRFGTIDFLANIAGGYAGGKTIPEVSVDEWDRMMNLNLRTAFLMCRETIKVMRRQKAGRIVNIGAMPAVTSGAKKGPYAIAKRGVLTLTETIAAELAGSGITANAIVPSIILTEENKSSMPDADTSGWVTPDEIAELILFLCSDAARSISGNMIKIFGSV